MSDFTWIYLGIGLFFVVLEHRLNLIDYSEATRRQARFGVAIQIVHYFRVWLTYPLYLAEDSLLVAAARGEEGEE